MKSLVAMLDGFDRRRFLEQAAKSLLGVSLVPAMSRAVSAAEAESTGKAKRLIYLFMSGGMTHLDTFDLKPGHPNQGATKPIGTNVAGIAISEFLPVLATEFDKIAVIRSMFTQTGDHEDG